MKKALWLGVVLAIAFSANIGLSAYADEKTNCIGDTSGQTNCVDSGADQVQSGLSIEPGYISFGQITEKGRSYTKEFAIKNNAVSEAVTVRVEAVEHSENADLSMTDWIVFVGGKRKFSVPAKGSVQVGVRVLVPSDAKGGTYYAKIVVSDSTGEEKESIDVRADVAGEEYKYGGELAAQKIGFFNVGDKVGASATIKNSGTAAFEASYLLQYKNAFGLDEWKLIIGETREVIPGTEAVFGNGASAKTVGYGVFTVEQRISYIDAEGKKKEAVLSHAVVNLPWWIFAIAGGVILVIVLIVVAIKLRRRKKAKSEKGAGKTEKPKKAPKKAKKADDVSESAEDVPEKAEDAVESAGKPKKAAKKIAKKTK